MTRGFGLVILAAIGCGGGKHAAAPGDPAEDCEPGRCMIDISRRVDDHRPEARACYDAGYKRDPTLQGTIVVNFEIDPDGKVADASQSVREEQIQDAEVVACVVDVIKQITFAKSGRGKLSRAFHRYEFSPP
jgi:hypothetical protein